MFFYIYDTIQIRKLVTKKRIPLNFTSPINFDILILYKILEINPAILHLEKC